MAKQAFVGLGANLGKARETIEHALGTLRHTQGIDSVTEARMYCSDPVEAQGPTFINTVARLTTTLEPLALLDVLQAIEQAHGRERPFRNAPRTLDLDLLWYEGVSMDTPRLTLPHPRMHNRAFVLKPLSELTTDLALEQGTIPDLLEQCRDQKVWPLSL
ncbi:2-amino-4-hydroxy-6-hydroxymethyldihydropteridine diphosphokinase [Zwartia vadi]|uniref:2-amino-4-hydroxy-6- hydroxymethyldihydropteridine diphosphokinase n=1 Tax=Zwartia vadi TaxID=3058168 RepID=UPI0025B4EF78|nr:2-amino-4-hydroxy-6-hydroxymethyldihydropteridine diphosphokinase [Zwartia vadi]MDN3986867.1 2-amino-4-hydroxy-6-hydroxymethyldihydropteridine diphosphokinase [Zwartia vadi]